MEKELFMGNQAIAIAAIDAGVEFVCGYPGTPSTEIIETIYQYKKENIYVEWSVNEKVALEVAAGASYSGYRCLVTMKQVGLNICSDSAMNLSYIGVKGGLVLVVADDPGPISSQTEQDTRNFAIYSKLPLLDPINPNEAYLMTQMAFEISEKYGTPVILRPTTRVCHSYMGIFRRKINVVKRDKEFKKNDKWVCLPELSYLNHIKVEERFCDLKREFEKYYNQNYGRGSTLIITSSVNYEYVLEAISFLQIDIGQYTLLKASTIPLPEEKIRTLLKKMDKIIVIEELDSVIERYIYYLSAQVSSIPPKILGKISGDIKRAGENTVDEIISLLKKVFFKNIQEENTVKKKQILEKKKPELCAGCPHRASFYVVKQATKGKKAIFCGDIGCYTLGKMKPLNMVDTCLCMGASITIGLGLQKTNPTKTVISFIGDSTFFHTGIQGILNGIYNNNKLTIIILDNLSTAMTGGQPTPSTGAIGYQSPKIVSIEQVVMGMGIKEIYVVSPFELEKAINIIQKVIQMPGIKVVIFRSPCNKKRFSTQKAFIDEGLCNRCGLCIKELGCPAIQKKDENIHIDQEECNGCGLCLEICKQKAIAYIGV